VTAGSGTLALYGDGPAYLSMYRWDATTGVAGQNIAAITSYGYSNTGVSRVYNQITFDSIVVTNGAEQGRIRFVTMAAGVLSTTLAVNDNDVAVTGTLTASSSITTTAGHVYSGASGFIGGTAQAVLAVNGAGTVCLRPGGYGVTAGQFTVASTGAATVNGSMTVNGALTATNNITGANVFSGAYFIGTAASAILGTNVGGTGSVYLRPVAYNSAVGQMVVDVNGNVSVATHITANGNVYGALLAASVEVDAATFSGTGATAGIQIQGTVGRINSSMTGSASTVRHGFYNSNGSVGVITTSGTTTAYTTTSDENLKELDAEMDPAEAIAIIKADPVLAFTWKATGEQAIGWFAQKSYAVNENLAVPPPAPAEGEASAKPGEEGYEPWGIDYGRRTPYLWAALSNALDRIEALEAKLSITDPKPTRKKK